jgi:tRNA pseudouridine(38-40) synthase
MFFLINCDNFFFYVLYFEYRFFSKILKVVSCRVRSALPKLATENKVAEMDYCTMLNNVLPADIRVLGWCTVTEEFSARFSASSRTYRYFFIKKKLNVAAMQEAASLLIGKHDFRNFCKIDVANVSNFVREIYYAKITPFLDSSGSNPQSVNSIDMEDGLWMLELNGIAFLWHMVRCIMAVLFSVGRGEEEPEIVTAMFDVEGICSSKPVYQMANEEPLVLHRCVFENLEMRFQPKVLWNLTSHFHNIIESHVIAVARARNALQFIENLEISQSDVDEFVGKLRNRSDKKTASGDIGNSMDSRISKHKLVEIGAIGVPGREGISEELTMMSKRARLLLPTTETEPPCNEKDADLLFSVVVDKKVSGNSCALSTFSIHDQSVDAATAGVNSRIRWKHAIRYIGENLSGQNPCDVAAQTAPYVRLMKVRVRNEYVGPGLVPMTP